MSRSHSKPSACRLALEPLDRRDLPAGISLADGVLTIAGSAFDDRGTVAMQNVGTPSFPIFKVVATLEHRATPDLAVRPRRHQVVLLHQCDPGRLPGRGRRRHVRQHHLLQVHRIRRRRRRHPAGRPQRRHAGRRGG